MSDYAQKVLWGEGMLLAPQHFQQSERYLEHWVQQRLRAMRALDWGLTSLEIDTDALAGGEFSLKELSGVLPGGAFVSIPASDPAPPPRQIGPAFPAGAEAIGVMIGIPRSQPGGLIAADDADALVPFDGAAVSLKDDTNSAREREVRLGRKRLRILFTTEKARERYHTLKIARLRRTASGFELDRHYIPACQYVSASARLRSMLRRILDIMVKKSVDLSAQRRSRDGLVDFTVSEAASFWFLHTLNGHIPQVRSLYRLARIHPLEVYNELSGLAGELYSFSAEGSPTDIPSYDPKDLTATFIGLERILLRLLGTVLPTRCVPIPLEKKRDLVYAAQIHDERLLNTGRWFLGVESSVGEERVVAEFATKAKLSSADQVDGLIVRALSGLELEYLESPPSEIPVQQNKSYFRLARSGEHWDAILAARSLAIYVPAEFTELKLELMAIKE